MSIEVRSNEPQSEVKVEEQKPAPELKKTPEQKETTDSDPVETEAEEASEESEDKLDLEGSDESEDSDKEKPKKKGGFQKKIDKLTARNTAAQQEVEYWKSMALKEKNAGESKEDLNVEKKSEVNGKPSADDFETHSEYVEAITDWKVDQKDKVKQQEAEKSKLLGEQEKIYQSHSQRVKAFAEKNEDFQDVIESVDDVMASPAVEDIIVSSENGPELMYELAKNRDEYERICKLSPIAAAREIGKIEARLAPNSSEEKKPEPKKLTNAPKPIGIVGGSKGVVRKSIDDPDISQADYERLRAEQTKKRRA